MIKMLQAPEDECAAAPSWLAVMDETTGEYYYWDPSTGKTTWEIPLTDLPSDAMNAAKRSGTISADSIDFEMSLQLDSSLISKSMETTLKSSDIIDQAFSRPHPLHTHIPHPPPPPHRSDAGRQAPASTAAAPPAVGGCCRPRAGPAAPPSSLIPLPKSSAHLCVHPRGPPTPRRAHKRTEPHSIREPPPVRMPQTPDGSAGSV